MSLRLGSVADDYTGASDLASTFAGEGLQVVQTIGVPSASLALPEVDAVVVALKTRSVPAPEAVARSLDAEAWLRARGAGHVLFKVCSTFESTDAGNIGPVTDALAGRSGAVPLVCPAFPRNGRTVFKGHLFVGDQRLDESPLRDHPLNPMRDSSLVRTLQRQSTRSVGLVPLETVEAGVEAVLGRAAALAAEGAGSFIADAVLDRHLDVLGRAALAQPVSTGASGLGVGLARALGAQPGAAVAPGTGPRDAALPATLILAGSCSAATLEQIARAEAAGMPVLRLDVENAMDDGAAVAARACAWARERLPCGPALVAASRPPAEVAALQQRFGTAASARLEALMADLAEQLAGDGLHRLIVAGGETSGAVVDRLGLQAFTLGREIAAGVPLVTVIGARHPGLSLVLKSGNFGGADFFSDAARAG